MNDVSAVTGPAPILEEEEEEDGDVAAEGVEDKDIELVMSQVTRIRSIGSKVSILEMVNFFPHSGKRLQRKGCESPAEQRQRHCQRDHGAHDVENQTGRQNRCY